MKMPKFDQKVGKCSTVLNSMNWIEIEIQKWCKQLCKPYVLWEKGSE